MVTKDYSDAELLAIPPVIVDPGITDENGVLRGAHYRNPFYMPMRTNEPGAAEAFKRWSDLHWGAQENETSDDPFSIFLSELAFEDSGFHRHENSENGNTVFFPAVPNHPAGSEARRKLEADWEAVCLAMHDAQRPIELARKPQPNGLERGMVRAD